MTLVALRRFLSLAQNEALTEGVDFQLEATAAEGPFTGPSALLLSPDGTPGREEAFRATDRAIVARFLARSPARTLSRDVLKDQRQAITSAHLHVNAPAVQSFVANNRQGTVTAVRAGTELSMSGPKVSTAGRSR